jgi:hypothetical protein
LKKVYRVIGEQASESPTIPLYILEFGSKFVVFPLSKPCKIPVFKENPQRKENTEENSRGEKCATKSSLQRALAQSYFGIWIITQIIRENHWRKLS